MTKTCARCGETKATEQFSWRNKSKGWLRSECKTCQKADYCKAKAADPVAYNAAANARKRAWRAANPDADKLYYAKNLDKERLRQQKRSLDPEYRAKVVARSKRWYAANKARHRASVQAWNARNKEYLQQYYRQYCQDHLPELREKSRKRRALKLDRQVEPFTLQQLDARMSVFGHRCAYCDGPFEEVDHAIPLARGGLHCLANLRPACTNCNRRKWAKPLSAWLCEVA